jgi:glycosyltransferase involved in cell wall biosynthesis
MIRQRPGSGDAAVMVPDVRSLQAGFPARTDIERSINMSSKTPMVSIIVPIHNVSEYLRETLDSTVSQTLRNIEIICVDDCSDDGSGEILGEYAERDPRIKVITYTENKTASQARKDGVMAARGEYILFLDGDDSLETDACSELYNAMRKYDVDMIHFGTTVLNCSNMPEPRVRSAEKFLEPYPHQVKGGNLCRLCFMDKKWGFSLWNKIYTRELCRKAFGAVEDGTFPKAQDKYAFFLLSYYARSYMGLTDTKFYRYGFGRGITGHEIMGIKQFERSCTQALVPKAVRRFLEREGRYEEYKDIVMSLHEKLISDCVNMWYSYLDPALSGQGFDLLVRYWGIVDTLAFIAKPYWYKRASISDRLIGAQSLKRTKTEVKTIAVYYHNILNGGGQRLISLMIPLWIKSGYKVILCTDHEASPNDYTIPASVPRILLPDYVKTIKEKFGERAAAWERIIAEYHVDAVVYDAWLSAGLLWDLCAVKSTGAVFITHIQSVFSSPMMSNDPKLFEITHLFRLADYLVVLSRTDEKFWRCNNDHVKYIPNPVTFHLNDVKTAGLNNKNVLWIGRVSQEKNPLDAIEAFKIIVSEEPAARLLFVGDGKTPVAMKEVKDMIAKANLGDSVTLYGFQKTVGDFYSMASVMMVTSAYEGFPMALAESKVYGVPVVMYDLPYLEMVRDDRGLVTVPQRDVKAIAAGALDLLRNDEKRHELGAQARESIRDFAAYDIAASWKSIFSSMKDEDLEHTRIENDDAILVNTMIYHYSCGLEQQKKKFDALDREYKLIRNSESYRIGRLITYLPHKLKGKISAFKKKLRKSKG